MNRCSRLLALAFGLAFPGVAGAQISAQEGVLAAKPAVVLVTARVDGDVTVDCGRGAVTVKAAPFVETGTGWFVDGRGFVVTNAHVIDPVHTNPPWVQAELRKSGVEKACGVQGAKRVDVKTTPSLVVMLANGRMLPATVKKFSAPIRLDKQGKAHPDSGRDLALLQLAPGVYPSIALGPEMPRIGEPVQIIGFPGVVLGHELLSKRAAVEATVTAGAVSGFKQDLIGQDVIQTDASAAHGNSGGPAVSTGGKVLGVLTFVSLGREGDVVQGFNFLVPVRDVRKFLGGTDAASPTASAFDTAWRGVSTICSPVAIAPPPDDSWRPTRP
jgi:S1-C subfamily serine protease